jgi:hypothetical protein
MEGGANSNRQKIDPLTFKMKGLPANPNSGYGVSSGGILANGLPPKHETRMSPEKMFVKRNGNLNSSNLNNDGGVSLGDPSTSHLINGLQH